MTEDGGVSFETFRAPHFAVRVSLEAYRRIT